MTPQDLAGAEELRGVFRRELDAPEFAVVEESVLTRLLRMLWEAVENIWSRLFPDGLQAGPSPWMAAVFVLLGLLLVFFLVKSLRGRRGGSTRRAPRSGQLGAAAAPPDWRVWADGRAAEGALGDAATGYYRAALDLLASRGVLEYGEWKTPGDYLDEVDPSFSGRSRFVAFVSDFVTTTFGVRGPDPESVARLAGRLDTLEASP